MKIDRNKTIMVTGHRQIYPSGEKNKWPSNPKVLAHHKQVVEVMQKFILNCINQGYENFISGMALGTDQLFSEAVVGIKYMGFPIKLIAAIPFMGQESAWPVNSQKHFNNLLNHSDEVHVVSEGSYSAHKMQVRNEWMVDRSCGVLTLYNGTSSGTKNCLNYAIDKVVWIYKIDPLTLEFERLK